jgi:hypothetical protein
MRERELRHIDGKRRAIEKDDSFQLLAPVLVGCGQGARSTLGQAGEDVRKRAPENRRTLMRVPRLGLEFMFSGDRAPWRATSAFL